MLREITSQAKSHTKPAESAKAAQAFADYVAQGPSRSLDALHACYQSATKPVPTKRIGTLKEWSVKFNWQSRLVDAATARSTAMLEHVDELDADTSLKVARETNRRAEWADALKLDELFRMRESVRKPLPKNGASVSVNVSVEVRHLAEQMAKSLGISPEELIADAELIAAEKWETAV